MNESKFYKGFYILGNRDRLYSTVSKNTSGNKHPSWSQPISYPIDQKVFEAKGKLEIGKNGIHFSKSINIILNNLPLEKCMVVVYECITEDFIYDDGLNKGCCKKLTIGNQIFGIDFSKYSYVRPLEGGLFRVKKDLWGAIDLAGNTIIPFEFTFIGDLNPKDKTRQLGWQTNDGLKEYVMDKDFKISRI